MEEKAQAFKDTYSSYLAHLREIDLQKRADILGARFENDELHIPFFNSQYAVSGKGVRKEWEEGEAAFAVSVVLCKYILMSQKENLSREPPRLIAFRDFKDAAPLLSYFTSNTSKTIEIAYAGKVDSLRQKSSSMGGIEQHNEAYDFSATFFALPKIPIVLNFNDTDEDFKAKANILYQSDACDYLDMECLAIVGTYLIGQLL